MKYKASIFFIIFAGLIKFIAIFYTNFDLFGDEAQYWIWAQNPDYGYYSKPPLLAWIISLITVLFGSSFATIKLIPFFIYFFTTYIIYLLTLNLYKNRELAIIAAISFFLLPAVTVSSFLLSTDVVLIFFWSLCLLMLLKIRRDPSVINFLLLGIFLGLSFLTKYAAFYFLISLILILVFDKKTKEVFFKKIYKSLFFLFSFLIVLLPNILWNVENNWVTLMHTSDNVGLNRLRLSFFEGLKFFISQVLMLGPLLFLGFLIFFKKIKFNFQSKFFLFFSLPIFSIIFIESILVRANANWAAVALVSFFIFILNLVYAYSKKLLIINNFINFVFCLLFFIMISTTSSINIFNRINGISEFAYELQRGYLQKTKYLVVEDRLLYSNLRYIYRNSQITILTPHSPKQKVTSHFHISDPLLQTFNKNFIFIGNPSEIAYLINKNLIKEIENSKVLFKKSHIKIYEVIF